MTTYSDSDPFAWVYNKHWGDSFTHIALNVMEKLVLPTAFRVLEQKIAGSIAPRNNPVITRASSRLISANLIPTAWV